MVPFAPLVDASEFASKDAIMGRASRETALAFCQRQCVDFLAGNETTRRDQRDDQRQAVGTGDSHAIGDLATVITSPAIFYDPFSVTF